MASTSDTNIDPGAAGAAEAPPAPPERGPLTYVVNGVAVLVVAATLELTLNGPEFKESHRWAALAYAILGTLSACAGAAVVAGIFTGGASFWRLAVVGSTANLVLVFALFSLVAKGAALGAEETRQYYLGMVFTAVIFVFGHIASPVTQEMNGLPVGVEAEPPAEAAPPDA
ncbi:MAG: hypothetical protein ACE5GW_05445 [Planctomycetota bacterium]